MESKEFDIFRKIRKLLFPHIDARVANVEKHRDTLKIWDKDMGEPGVYDWMLLSAYATFCSTNLLQEKMKDLVASSKRLEKATWILIGITIVLAVLTVKLISMQG